jgi:hypothetical protein
MARTKIDSNIDMMEMMVFPLSSGSFCGPILRESLV